MAEGIHGLTPWAHAIVMVLAGAGMLMIVPLGLSLIAVPGPGVATVRRWWVVVALPAAVSLWLPRGLVTATMALPYLTAAAVLLTGSVIDIASRGRAAGRSAHGRDRHAVRDRGFDLALLTALAGPMIAASALVAERAGDRLFGFGLGTLELTVVHFHYAGFAAALVAALLLDREPGPVTALAAWCVPGGTLIVLIGYFAGDPVQLAGAAVLTLGMWLTGWVTWRAARPVDRVTRVLFRVGAAVLAATMVLALDWASGLPHLSVSWMVATHGVANASGFALCSLLAWRRVWGVVVAPTSVVPVVNQIELHPYFSQPDVQKADAEHGILTRAWSPTGGITFYPGSGDDRRNGPDPDATREILDQVISEE
jgi:YndJ-like protein